MAALWYHFFNGIRHLVWDTGAGFALDQIARRAASPCCAATAVMTVITLIIALV